MRRSIAVLAAAIVSMPVAAAHVLSPDRPISRPLTLRYQLKGDGNYFNDVNPAGPSIGDQLTSHSVLLKRGDAVGHLGATCTVTGAQAVCTAVIWVHGGQIALTGQLIVATLGNAGSSAHLAVTGGTGAFRHVHGEARIVFSGRPTSTLTLQLTP